MKPKSADVYFALLVHFRAIVAVGSEADEVELLELVVVLVAELESAVGVGVLLGLSSKSVYESQRAAKRQDRVYLTSSSECELFFPTEYPIPIPAPSIPIAHQTISHHPIHRRNNTLT